ncbi:MAG: hypothetical protein ACTSQS_18330 [Promethearchaeota archaeon]
MFKRFDKLSKEEVYEKLEIMMEKMIKEFEKKFNVKCWTTTCEDFYYDDGDVSESYYEVEYEVDGLIKSDVLNIGVGGWFSIRLNGNGDCWLVITIDGDSINEDYCLMNWYDNVNGWEEFVWEAM